MADNTRPQTTDEMLANALRTDEFQDSVAVGVKRGNRLADEEMVQDLENMGQFELRQKYGEDVALNRHRLLGGTERLEASDNSEQSVGSQLGDLAVSAATGAYRDLGTLGILADSYSRALINGEGTTGGQRRAAELLDAHANMVAGIQQENLSFELRERQRFAAIEGQLDAADSQAKYNEEVEEGSSPFMAGLRQQGRDALSAVERYTRDPSMAGNIIGESLGSMVFTAPLGGVSGAVAKGMTARMTSSALAQRVAQATAVSAATGSTEVSNLYSEAVSDVMSIPLETLSQTSPVFQSLMAEGMTPEEARIQLAGMTAETSAIRQIAPTLAFGYLTSKFEALGPLAFRGNSTAQALLQVAGEGVEEALQGGSATINRNVAVEEMANIGRGVFEGVGEEMAVGALAGMGTAGILGSPRAAQIALGRTGQVVDSAADALFNEVTSVDPETGETTVRPSPVARATESAFNAGKQATDLAKTAGQKVAQQARDRSEALSPVIAYVADTIDKSTNKEARKTVEDALNLNEMYKSSVDPDTEANITEEMAAPAPETIPENFRGLEGSNVVETVAGITAKLSERGFRPSDDESVFIAEQYQRLSNMAESLPANVKRQIGVILDSPTAKKIREKAATLDLNSKPAEGEITPQETSTTLNVAKVNPANVNPDRTDQILEQSGENFSERDLKIMRVASKVARMVNDNVGTKIEIRNNENISLTQQGEAKKGENPDDTSRSIHASGFRNSKGIKLRSLNDFAADIIKGVQSPTGKFIDNQGRPADVKKVAVQLRNFAEHMMNRVDALNKSYDSNSDRNGVLIGKPMKFRGLANGVKFYDAEDPNNYFRPVTYHRGRAGSVANAERVENDANSALQTLEIIKAEFPELFEGLPEVNPVALKRDTDQPNPTADEEVSRRSETDEQQQQTQEQTTPPTASDEPSPDGEEDAPVTEDVSSPTVVEEEGNSESGDDETGAPATDESVTNEEINSDEPVDTEESVMEWASNPERWGDARDAVVKMTNEARNVTRGFLNEVYGAEINRLVRQIRIYPQHKNLGPGYAHVSDDGTVREIFLSDHLFNENMELTKLGRAVVLHETAHVIDFSNVRRTDDPDFISARNTFRPDGDIYKESLFLESHSPWVKKRMDYANSYKGDDDVAHRAELFAVMTEFYFSKDGSILENSPAILQLMEEVYGPRERTATTGVTTDDEQTSTEGSPSDDAGGSTSATETRKLNPEFDKNFKDKKTEGHPKTLGEALDKAKKNNMNSETVRFVEVIAPIIRDAMNARLNKKIVNDRKNQSILKHILDGKDIFRVFRAGVLVDRNTNKYDPDMVELASIAMADWLLTNTGSNPNQLDDTLEKMGVSLHEISEEDLDTIINGVAPSFAAHAVARDVMRLWDIDENQDAPTDALEGVVQGFVKEMFTALSEETDLITIPDVTLFRDGKEVQTQSILVNNQAMKDIRKDIQANNTAGVKMTAREALFGDQGEIYSIGTKQEKVNRRQDRSGVQLSDMEQAALKNMQDIPSMVDENVRSVYNSFEPGVLQEIFGFNPNVDGIKNPVLRRSVIGKNASVLLNLDETYALTQALPENTQDVPVYFPIGITRVGRHQFKGPNPQANKVMRAMLAPTWSTVNVDNLDNFWLAIGLASDITGINKVEKLQHSDIISNASSVFNQKFGPAVQMVRTVLKGGEMDSQSFKAAVGVIEPQQMKAIIAVAQMENAVENGDSTFETSLSFELDGLTNGVANMMVNFGQGDLTDADFNNFQRVGLFLGETGRTVNSFYNQKGALDMYETVARTGDSMMTLGNESLKQWQKDQRLAASRIATVIGNFDKATGQMTRNTAKNPMTKVNYGSGVKGVGVGVADDMMLKFYEDMQTKPPAATLDEFYYPGFMADMKALSIDLPAKPNPEFVLNKEATEKFRTSIQYTIGDVLTDATKETIGDKITQLNDMMVMATNLQSQYIQMIYNQRLEEIGEKLAKEGVIGRNVKTKKPNLGQIPRKYFKELEKELMQLAPLFISDDQTLAIGGFKNQLSDLTTSMNFDGRLNQKTVMPLPDDVGVKWIPFTVIGSGDAMTMNLIFSGPQAPKDVLPVYDGIDIPLDKIQEYAPYINQMVGRSWERDVMGMAIQNFQSFLNSNLDQDVLKAAFAAVLDKNKNSTVSAVSVENLKDQLEERLRQNRARKKVFKSLAISVDQMGGSDTGWSRDGAEINLLSINARIQRELEGKPQEVAEDVKSPVHETTVKELFPKMKLNDTQKKVMSILGAEQSSTRVVMGTIDQLRDWMAQNLNDSANVLRDVKGAYDVTNDILFLTTLDAETFVHEMVHAATFNKVMDHYEGNTNQYVKSLETLMNEFLELDGGQNVQNAQAAILRHLTVSDPARKAAAVNEFMAYALSNQYVKQKLEKTETSLLKTLADKVINLMRRLMGGIPKDMFSHTVFNTEMLINPDLGSDVGFTGGNGDGGDSGNGGNGSGGGDGGERTPMANNYTDYWIKTFENYIDSLDTENPQDDNRLRRASINEANADRVMDSLRQAGLLRNPNDRKTFRAIYGIMKSEMKLDPNSLIALTRVFQHVEEAMTPEMFGSGTEANNTYSAILNSFGGFKEGDTSDAVAVLFALSQTSEKFRNVLDQIPEPETQTPGSGLNAFMARGTQVFMNKLMGSIKDGAPQEVMDGLKATLIDSNREGEYAALRAVTNALDTADEAVSRMFGQIAEGMRSIDRNVKEEAANTTKQYLVSAVTYTTNFLDKPGSDLNAEAAQKVAHMGLPILKIVPIRELVDEFVGTTRTNADFVQMQDIVKWKVSGVRQSYREKLPGILNSQFSTEPHPEQWKSMYQTLAKTDFTTVIDLSNMQRSMQLLEETGVRQARIQQLESQLQGNLNASNFQDAKDKGMQLAKFMNGRGAGKLLVRNAYAIVKQLEGNAPESLVPVLDELITLYAISDMDADIRETTVQLWQNEPKAITAIVSYIQGLNEVEDQKIISEAARLNGYKGYISNVGRDNHRVVIAEDSREEEMIHRGFKKVAPFTGDPSTIYPQSYYVTNISQQGAYSQGIMQNVASTYRGVDTNTGLTMTGDTSGFISADEVDIDDMMGELLDETYELENEGETLIPVFDGNNELMGFERTIAPEIASAFLGRDENLARNLGAWAGRQVEEGLATQYNKALVDKLDALWTGREAGTEHEFVNLKETKDPIYRESFKLIPQEIKAYMDTKFDGDGPMVPESMVNLSVGYREASIADLWTGKTRMPKELVKVVRAVTKSQIGEKSIRTLLVQGEKATQSLISDAKDIIVVKSLIVPMVNTQANIIQLGTNGVPAKQIMQNYRSKLAEIVEYNKNIVKRMELDNQIRLTPDPRKKRLLEDRIQVIDDLNAKMTIAPMIQVGAYKQLSEGITDMDLSLTNGGLADWLETQAEKLPDTMSSIAKTGLVSKSSDLYQAANRATQYGDFLAKSIYYDHLLSKGLSEMEAMKIVNEEFVNFSVNPGRFRSMLERNGLIWFMAFKLRITKVAMKQMRDNPVRAMALNSLVDIGSPVQDNIFSVIGDGRLGYSTGWEMLFGAPELNPWVNLMNG